MSLSHGEHYELMNDLEDKLGKKTAVRLAEALPPFDWNELARQAEVNSKIDALDARLSGRIDRLAGEVNALDGRLSGRIDHLSGEVNALKHEVAAQAEVMKAGFAELGSKLDAMEHKMLHRVYRTMFAVSGAVVAIVATIVT